MIIAPWSEDQVTSLNAFQNSGAFHAYTCRAGGAEHAPLVATTLGWRCENCDYQQIWAHEWTADWSWRDDPAGNWSWLDG